MSTGMIVKSMSAGMWHRTVRYMFTEVSKENITSNFETKM
jgi:hypothetical protein